MNNTEELIDLEDMSASDDFLEELSDEELGQLYTEYDEY